MELQDWISSIISGAALLVSALGYLKGQKALRIATAREINRPWRLDASTSRTGEQVGYIKYDVSAAPVRLLSIKAIEPKGLKLQYYGYRSSIDPDNRRKRSTFLVPDDAGPRPLLNVGDGANEQMVRGDTIASLLHMPVQPSWSRAGATSVRLVLRYEDLDAKRKRHEIDVWAHDVPWAKTT